MQGKRHWRRRPPLQVWPHPRGLAAAGTAVLALAGTGIPHAQDFPARPVRVIVGPGPDIVGRLLGQHYTEAWGQQVIIEPRTGGGGVIAAEAVARAAPDGYTLLLCSASYTINSVLQPASTNVLRDFAPVVFAASSPFVLMVHPALQARSLPELIALARARPGQLNYASSGNGTPPHLAAELFKWMARIDVTHVPYKAAGPAIIDTVGGQVQMIFAISSVAMPQVLAGKLRGIAVSSRERSRLAPDLPTLSESGLPGFEVIGWNGLVAPIATPRAVIQRLNAEALVALRQPTFQGRLVAAGYEPAAPNTPEQFGEQMRAEIAKWTQLVKETGMKVD